MIRKIWMLAVAAAWIACGPLDDVEVDPPSDREVYPVEGIGLKEGSVIRDISFKTDDGSAFSLGDVFADPTNRILLLTTTADWCSACKEETGKLAALHDEYAGKGLVVMAAMFEDGDFEPATVDNVRRWKEKYKTKYRVVLDEGFQLSQYYDRAQTPMNMVVDVDTMTIKRIMTGFDESAIRALVVAKVGR